MDWLAGSQVLWMDGGRSDVSARDELVWLGWIDKRNHSLFLRNKQSKQLMELFSHFQPVLFFIFYVGHRTPQAP
jgi:hypothetical protein